MINQAVESDVQLLPPVLRIVAQAAGIAAALRLVEQRGGVAVYVPLTAQAGHELATLVGLEGLQALCRAYQGQHLVVPMARAALTEIRNRQLLADRAAGKSVRDLSLLYNLHRRRVQQILREGCGQLADETPDLFA